MDSGKSFWNKVSPYYHLFKKLNEKSYNKMIEEIKKDLTKDMKVLEIGTATGFIALASAEKCKYIIATDYSEKMIAQAKTQKTPRNLRFETADGMNLQYKNKEFDAVIIANVLHIVPEPEKILENIQRVLKDGGLLLAPTFARNRNFPEYFKVSLIEQFGFKTFSNWSSQSYCQFIQNQGFSISKSFSINSAFPLIYVKAEKK